MATCAREECRAAMEWLEPRLLLAVGVPTSLDTYLLELINRGRADPAAEAARWGIALNEGLAANTITTAAKQPLAFHPSLIYAAQGHSQWMLDHDTFSHTGAGGSSPMSRMQTAGYTFTAPAASGENISMDGTTGSYDPTQFTLDNHSALFVDSGYPGRGHRINMMDPEWREIGTGVKQGVYNDGGTNYNTVMVTEDFAYSAFAGGLSMAYLCGVAYADTDTDDFYTPGEGIGSVTITATRVGATTTYQTTTWASGAYSLLVPQGTYDITARGGTLGGRVVIQDLTIGPENVKRDFRPEMVQPNAPPTLTTVAPLAGTKQACPFTITYAMLAAAADEDDTDGDPVSFSVDGVTTGTLKKGSANAGAGTLLGPGESFVWTSASDAVGLTDAFTVEAWDGAVLSATPVQVQIGVGVPQIEIRQGSTVLVSASLTPFSFGEAAMKAPAVDIEFQINNLGDAELVVSPPVLTGNTGFAVAAAPAAKVPAGGSTTLKIRMATAAVGDKAADVSIASDDHDATPFTFKVAGAVVKPVLSIEATTPTAAEEGRQAGVFTLSRTGPADAPLTAHYTVKGTATNGRDYGRLARTVAFAVGASTATLQVVPVDDATGEPTETVQLTLVEGAYGYGVDAAKASATVNLLDNEPVVSVVAIGPDAYEEGLVPGTFRISRNTIGTKPLAVRYRIAGAAAGIAYGRLGSLATSAVIPAGDTWVDVTITPLADKAAKGDKAAVLTLAANTAYWRTDPKTATIIIHDNDPTVSIVASDPDAAEAGLDKGTLTVARNITSASPLTVYYTVSGTATNGTDYVKLAGSVIIAANEATAPIDVIPIDDLKYEAPEKVTVTLRTNALYSISTTQKVATSTIQDDELKPDKYEDDDVALRAKAVAKGVAQLRNIDNTQDVDWLRFTLTKAGNFTYNIACAGASLVLAVLGPGNSTDLVQSTTVTDGGTGTWAFSPGTYYVRIFEDGQDATVGSYTMTLTLS